MNQVESVLFTGGIGDVITVESYLPVTTSQSIKHIYYATRAHKALSSLFGLGLVSFPNLQSQVALWEDFSNLFAFGAKEQVQHKLHSSNKQLPDNWSRVADCSIHKFFPDVDAGWFPYKGSCFLQQEIAPVDKFNLPADFVCICPYTVNDRRFANRDFSTADWTNVLAEITKRGVAGVVLNTGPDPIPEHPNIINLSNKTTLPESVEILKYSVGYMGIDSCLSVLAAQLFDRENLFIKSNNQHLFTWRHVYYAPHTIFPFILSRMDFSNDPDVVMKEAIKQQCEVPIMDSNSKDAFIRSLNELSSNCSLSKLTDRSPSMQTYYGLARHYQSRNILVICGGRGEVATVALTGVLDSGVSPLHLTVAGIGLINQAESQLRLLCNRSTKPIAIQTVIGTPSDSAFCRQVMGIAYDLVIIDGSSAPDLVNRGLELGWSVLADGGRLVVGGIDQAFIAGQCDHLAKTKKLSRLDLSSTCSVLQKFS